MMAKNFGTLKPHEVVRNDHPLTVLPNATENAFRMRVKENFDIIWNRVNLIIEDLRRPLAPQTFVSVGTATTTPGTTPTTPPISSIDEFRHAASLVNFKYDFYELIRIGGNVSQVVFKLVGANIANLAISYNLENQPEAFYMTGANTGSITLNYNNDGYLISMERI